MATEQTFPIKGMHCASCASIIERNLKKVGGVEDISVNYGNESARIKYDADRTNPEALSKNMESLGYTLVLPKKHEHMSQSEHAEHLGMNQSKEEKLQELASMRTNIISVLPLALFSALIMGWEIFAWFDWVAPMSYVLKEFFHHLFPIFATYTFVVVGKPYLLGLYRFLRTGNANMDTLIGLGTSVAFIYSFIITAFEDTLAPYINVEAHYYDVVIVVLAFIALGKYLETRSKLQTGDAIEKLLWLQAKTALVLRDGQEKEIPITEVMHGDIIRVKPGSRIPVDGVVLEGHSFVDESMITGEPIPTEKTPDQKVVAGTINTNGSFTFRATAVGSETLLASIIKMVEEAQGSKAPIQSLADKISAVFVPIVLVIAFLALAVWLVVGSRYLGFSSALSFGLASFVAVLVIACPCALGLATPTAIIVGVGKWAREGILVKDAATLEKLHSVNVIVVDKTGTITKGKPELASVQTEKMPEKRLVSLLASLESTSEHPIAEAITKAALERKIPLEPVTGFEIIQGKGLKGEIGGVGYFAGNAKLMRELKISFDEKSVEKETQEGKTPVFLASEKELLGIVFVSDILKTEAIEAVKNLHALGIRVIMLSGDSDNTARFIAKQAGIDEAIGEVSPEDKQRKIQELQKQGYRVAMAGDGVNDAPALAQADVGIAMGTGTDVAIASAGITLLGGDISKIVKAIHLSRATIRTIKQNLFWAFIYNLVGIPLAAGLFYPFFGLLLSPVFAWFAMAASSVSVVMNSLRLKTRKL